MRNSVETINVRGEEVEFKVIDTNNSFYRALYRGANDGIELMSAGSFYSTDIAIAASYALMEENSTIYCFNYYSLNLIDIDDTENGEEDKGILAITDDELSNYDGYIARGGVQVCLFGRFDVTTGEFIKSSIEECRADANADYREYGR